MPAAAHFLAREQMDNKIDIFGAMVVIFPDVTNDEAPMVIDPLQHDLKPSFVQEGLMLGEFHPHSARPGLRNRYFCPLRSPIPLLAIRHMVESDVDFLMAPNDPAPMRVKSLQSVFEVSWLVVERGQPDQGQRGPARGRSGNHRRMNLAGVNEIAATIDQQDTRRPPEPEGSHVGPFSSALLDVLLKGDPN